jgi:hypothetical protein
MSRKSKLTKSHSTLMPFAQQLRRWGEKEESVDRIVAGLIRRTRSSTNTIKIKQLSGCIRIIAKSPVSIQEINFYVSDAVTFISNLCEHARENNIKVMG